MVPNADNSIDWTAESRRFDGVARRYDAFRPSYPSQLIDDVVTLAKLRPEAEILEIGSGTGKATRLFARRGFGVLCLEPGANLVEVAGENLREFPRIRFEQARFEEWEPGNRTFDLVFSAQAFHWVPVAIRYPKTAAILKPHGHLALFWNMYPGLAGEFGRELDQVYRDYAPELIQRKEPFDRLIEARARSLRESPFFENIVVRQYPWSVCYDAEKYLGLLGTYSDHLRLPERQRRRLFTAVSETIERRGGTIKKPYLAVLYCARRV